MRYISDKNISFSLPVNGLDKRFRFTPRMGGGSIYVTDIPAEMRALEASNMYGRVYRRTPDCENEEIESESASAPKAKGKAAGRKKKGEATEVPEVKTWQDAVDYLVDNFGLNATALATPDDIMQEAAKQNISFPELKG